MPTCKSPDCKNEAESGSNWCNVHELKSSDILYNVVMAVDRTVSVPSEPTPEDLERQLAAYKGRQSAIKDLMDVYGLLYHMLDKGQRNSTEARQATDIMDKYKMTGNPGLKEQFDTKG